MPIYEYECPECGEVFEEWLKEYDVDEAPCPKCGASAKRVISNTSFMLKGGGWYATEYTDRRPGFMSGKKKAKTGMKQVKPGGDPADGTAAKPVASENAGPAASDGE